MYSPIGSPENADRAGISKLIRFSFFICAIDMQTNLDTGKTEIAPLGTNSPQFEIAGEILALTKRMASLERDYQDAVRAGETKTINFILESKRVGYRQIWKLRKEAGEEHERVKRSSSRTTPRPLWNPLGYFTFWRR